MPMTATTQRTRGRRSRSAARRGRPRWTLLLRTRCDANRFAGSPPKSPDRRASWSVPFWLYMTVRDDLLWSACHLGSHVGVEPRRVFCSHHKGTARAMSRAGRGSSRTAGKRLVRVGLAGLLVMSGASGTMAGTAGAATDDGTLTVEVLRDFFGTGVINTTMDVPQKGMSVDVADREGHHVAGITDTTGKVVVSKSAVLTGGQY